MGRRAAAELWDYVLVIAGALLAVTAYIAARFWHLRTHGICSCTPGQVIEYAPGLLILGAVVVWTVSTLARRSREHRLALRRQNEAQRDLLAAQLTINRLVEFNDLQLASIDLRGVGRQLTTDSMMEMIQLGSSQIARNEPDFGMLVFAETDGSLSGSLYSRAEGRDALLKTEVEFPQTELLKLTVGLGDIRTSSFEQEDTSLAEYQLRFHANVRAITGEIHNYLAYRIPGNPGGVLVLFNFARPPRDSDKLVIKAMVYSLGSMTTLQDQLEKRRQAQLAAMAKLAELAESRDPETGEHLQRIAHFSRALAAELLELGQYNDVIDEDFVEDLFHSSPLHDIGKVGIEDAILRKPGKLTDEEYERMKAHAVIGGKVLDGVEFMEMARDIAWGHHEKWDGSGYPFGKRELEIPLAARIVAIVDVYDALTTKRVYKDAFSKEKTHGIMVDGRGKHFDPGLLDVFLSLEDRLAAIREKYAEPEPLA